MALDALNSAPTGAPPRDKTRRLNDVVADSWRTSKRSKRQRLISRSEDEYLAACLVMLARSGGGPYPSSSADKTSQSTPEIKSDGAYYKKPDVVAPVTTTAASHSAGESKHDGDPIVQETATPAATAPPEADVERLKASVVPTTPPQPAVAVSYKCSFCGKAFSSYQALGGHKASHRTKPATPPEYASEKESPYAVIPDCIPAVKPSGRLHECLICHKSFTSGQALGGHKRKHYEGVIGNGAAPKTQTTSTTGGEIDRIAAAAAAVIRNFDLNMPPPLEHLCHEEVESALPPPLFV